MIFGFGKKKRRHVVQTTLVAVDGDAFAPLIDITTRAQARMQSAPEDFEVASEGIASVARALLDHQDAWTMAAAGGDIFDDEASASGQVAEVFADLSTRYQNSASDNLPAGPKDGTSHERRCVVMLTVGYAGEEEGLEQDLGDRNDLVEMLRAIIALHERDGLLAAQVHIAPAHPEDRLSDEQLLVAFPELSSI